MMVDEQMSSLKSGWPKQHTSILINLLVDQVTRGKMKNGQFGKNAWQNITSDLVAQVKRAYSVGQVKETPECNAASEKGSRELQHARACI